MVDIQTTRNQEILNELLKYSMESTLSSFDEGHGLERLTTPLNNAKLQRFSRIMLTISGVHFRAVLLLNYMAGAAGVTLLNQLRANEKNSASGDIEPFYMEMGNQLCGEMKRFLHNQFDALGMSTPFIMSNTTMVADIADENMLAECHEFYKRNDDVVLGSSFYVFSKQALIFEFDKSGLEDTSKAGELDFF